MTDLLIGILGGGAVVQLVDTVIHRRQNARQINANALGTEVQALERTIVLLKENLEAEMERHRRDRDDLLARITELERRNEEMHRELEHLRSRRENREIKV